MKRRKRFVLEQKKKNLKYWVGILSKSADLLIHVKRITDPIALASIGLRFADSIIDSGDPDREASFPESEYYCFDLDIFSEKAKLLLKTKYADSIEYSDAKYCSKYYIPELGIGFYEDSQNSHMFLLKNKSNKIAVFTLLSELFWDTHNKIVEMFVKQKVYYPTFLDINFDDEIYYRPKIYEKIKNHVVKFIDKNKNRTNIIYGRSGSGKSKLISELSKELKLNTIIIDSFFMNDPSFALLIEIIKPECLIINDYIPDNSSQSLKNLEAVKKNVKLTLMTTNIKKDRYASSNIRPQRTDKIWEMNDIEIEIKEKFLPDRLQDEEIRKKALSMPISYVKEFAERCEILEICNDKKALQEELEEIFVRQKDQS